MSLSMNNKAHRSLRARQTAPAAISALALALGLAVHPAASSAADSKQQVSHTIGPQMQAAQKALQAQQWAEALKNLSEAETKSGLTPFDKKTIYDFKGFAEFRLGKYK